MDKQEFREHLLLDFLELRINKHDKDVLRRYAAKQDKTISAIVREALEYPLNQMATHLFLLDSKEV